MATYVICHGAWGGGWAWKKMRALMRAAGHEFVTPTYTGLGERAHLAHPMVGLETHIQDVRATLEYEDLRDVILVGHSYGGMVATGVGDRVPDRVRHLVYLDAFVPSEGQVGQRPERRSRPEPDRWMAHAAEPDGRRHLTRGSRLGFAPAAAPIRPLL